MHQLFFSKKVPIHLWIYDISLVIDKAEHYGLKLIFLFLCNIHEKTSRKLFISVTMATKLKMAASKVAAIITILNYLLNGMQHYLPFHFQDLPRSIAKLSSLLEPLKQSKVMFWLKMADLLLVTTLFSVSSWCIKIFQILGNLTWKFFTKESVYRSPNVALNEGGHIWPTWVQQSVKVLTNPSGPLFGSNSPYIF